MNSERQPLRGQTLLKPSTATGPGPGPNPKNDSQVKMTEDKINYTVFWSDEDPEYAGASPQFPSLSWIDKDPDQAYAGIRKLVAKALQDSKHSDQETNPTRSPKPRN